MKKTAALWFALACGFAGCATTHRELSTEERNAQEAITRAEDAGAKKYSGGTLEAAKDDLARAKTSEEAATRDRVAAHEQLTLAQQRNDRARRRMLMRQALLNQDEEERKSQLLALDASKTRADEMRARGVPEEDVARVQDERTSMIKIRIKGLESEKAALEKEIAAMDNVKRDSEMEMQTARARLKTSEDRLDAARATYRQVEDRANLARAEALDARRNELSDKISTLSP